MNQPPSGWPPQPPQSQPPQSQLLPAQPQPPPMGAVSRGRGWVVPAAAGFDAAVLVGGVLLATNVVSFGSGGGSVDTAPISLPEQLPGLDDYSQFLTANASGPKEASNQTERYEKQRALTIEEYQRAYDGAAVDTRIYQKGDTQIWVVAIRAPSPGLTTGRFADPQAPYADVIVDGDVECLILGDEPVTDGEEIDPDTLLALTCQRSDDSLTVFTLSGGTEGPEGRALMIETTNEAFDAVS